MTTFSLNDLTTPLTRAQVQASIYEVLGILGVNTTSWKPGSVVRTMIGGASLVLTALSDLQAKVARSGFIQLSDGQWLTLAARYVYEVERISATFATGEITLTNAGGGVYSFDPGDLIFSNSTTGKTYRNTAAVNLGALATVSVAIQATEAGASSTSAPGSIDTMITTVLGVTCENLSQLTGTDEETDAALRTRCSEKLGSLSPFGPWDAYAYAVRNATRSDGTSIGVTRVRLGKDGYGNVNVTLAGVDGAVPGDVDDDATDLGIARAAIELRAVPEAVTAIVASATNHAIAVTYTAWAYESTRTDEEFEQVIADALEAFMRARPIGGDVIGTDSGKVFVNALRSAVMSAAPEVFNATVSLPAGDVALTSTEVPVLSGVPTATIHREPPPEGFGGSFNA